MQAGTDPANDQRGKLRLHRTLGRWGACGPVPLLVAGGAVMIHAELAKNGPYPPGVAYVLGALDVYSLPLFPIFVFLAIRYGRQVQLHARYMACTVMVLVPPALGRALFFLPGCIRFSRC